MVNFLYQGVEVVLWLQQFSPTLDLLFKSITTQILISLAGPILLMLLNLGKDPAVLSSASVLMGVCTGFVL